MSSPIVVATSAAGLKVLVSTPVDGQAAVIRVGSGADSYDIPLTYNAELGKWIGKEFEVIRGQDQLDAQCKATFTTKQLLSTNTDDSIAGGDVLYHFASAWRVGEAFTAGLGLEYRQDAMLLATKEPFKKVNIGACLFAVAAGDTRVTSPTEAWAETAYMLGGREWPGGVPVYEWKREKWKALLAPGGGALAANTKSSLSAGVYGFMESGATAGGGMTSYALWLRFII